MRTRLAQGDENFEAARHERFARMMKVWACLGVRSLMMEFHISRDARQRYQFAETLFSYTGNVVFANMGACREFAYRMNLVRDV
jgi:hypothetical protein